MVEQAPGAAPAAPAAPLPFAAGSAALAVALKARQDEEDYTKALAALARPAAPVPAAAALKAKQDAEAFAEATAAPARPAAPMPSAAGPAVAAAALTAKQDAEAYAQMESSRALDMFPGVDQALDTLSRSVDQLKAQSGAFQATVLAKQTQHDQGIESTNAARQHTLQGQEAAIGAMLANLLRGKRELSDWQKARVRKAQHVAAEIRRNDELTALIAHTLRQVQYVQGRVRWALRNSGNYTDAPELGVLRPRYGGRSSLLARLLLFAANRSRNPPLMGSTPPRGAASSRNTTSLLQVSLPVGQPEWSTELPMQMAVDRSLATTEAGVPNSVLPTAEPWNSSTSKLDMEILAAQSPQEIIAQLEANIGFLAHSQHENEVEVDEAFRTKYNYNWRRQQRAMNVSAILNQTLRDVASASRTMVDIEASVAGVTSDLATRVCGAIGFLRDLKDGTEQALARAGWARLFATPEGQPRPSRDGLALVQSGQGAGGFAHSASDSAHAQTAESSGLSKEIRTATGVLRQSNFTQQDENSREFQEQAEGRRQTLQAEQGSGADAHSVNDLLSAQTANSSSLFEQIGLASEVLGRSMFKQLDENSRNLRQQAEEHRLTLQAEQAELDRELVSSSQMASEIQGVRDKMHAIIAEIIKLKKDSDLLSGYLSRAEPSLGALVKFLNASSDASWTNVRLAKALLAETKREEEIPIARVVVTIPDAGDPSPFSMLQVNGTVGRQRGRQPGDLEYVEELSRQVKAIMANAEQAAQTIQDQFQKQMAQAQSERDELAAQKVSVAQQLEVTTEQYAKLFVPLEYMHRVKLQFAQGVADLWSLSDLVVSGRLANGTHLTGVSVTRLCV